MNSDSTCEFCDAPTRWCRVYNRNLEVDYLPVAEGGSYVVIVDVAQFVPKVKRHQHAKLYRPHAETCTQAELRRKYYAEKHAAAAARARQNVLRFPELGGAKRGA